MSRLASQGAAGFFPTHVFASLLCKLTGASGGARRVIRVVDPCAGTGEPLAAIAEALGAESYGIEINTERAQQCRTRLDQVLATSAFSVRLANGAFSLLWLNPPYDSNDEQRRL
jgi:predicted RNA methylase